MEDPNRQPETLLSRSLSDADLPAPEASLELLARAQAGDRAALEELLTRYQSRLHRIVRIQLGSSRLRRHLDSMDLVQCTFRAALPKLAELRPRSAASLLRWLAVIATNQLRDAHGYLQAEKRGGGRQVSTAGELGDVAVPDAASPEDEALLAEVRELLDAEVARLPPDQRQVVLLRDYCGEGWERIAEELVRGPGAARQLHQRAWIRLRRALRPLLEQHDEPPLPS